MMAAARSLNLAVSVAVAAFEARTPMEYGSPTQPHDSPLEFV